jgi:protein TonB
MPEAGFLDEKRASAGSLTIVIALHAAAITAVMLSKTEFVRKAITPIEIIQIPEDKPPPPVEPEPRSESEVRQKTVVTQVPPKIVVERPVETVFERADDIEPVFDLRPSGDVVTKPVPLPLPEPKPVPVPEPVRKDAQMLASAQLQPPYPASEERAGTEGSVTVRVRIGADGRVKEVEKVRGSNDAFFRATQQQALRHWRFKPATVDGQPVETSKVMTVHFQLTA